jgi:hypothetical protein
MAVALSGALSSTAEANSLDIYMGICRVGLKTETAGPLKALALVIATSRL